MACVGRVENEIIKISLNGFDIISFSLYLTI